MKVIDKNLLLEFRLMRQCAWCKKKVEECDPAHIFSRGAGRVDIRENIVNLCRECHFFNHCGQPPTKNDLLFIASVREGKDIVDIVHKIMMMRLDTKCKIWEVS